MRRLTALSGVVAAGLLAACAAPLSQEAFDARLKALDTQFDQAVNESAATARVHAAAELPQLTLPVRDHLSTLQYCAFLLRHADAMDDPAFKTARAKAALRPAADPPPVAAVAALDWGALFPTLRDKPYFEYAVSDPGSAARTWVANDTGSCTILTMGDPTAAPRAKDWLTAGGSAWTFRKSSGQWRGYKVRNPTLWESDLLLAEAVVPEAARKAGVSAVHVVAIVGLP